VSALHWQKGREKAEKEYDKWLDSFVLEINIEIAAICACLFSYLFRSFFIATCLLVDFFDPKAVCFPTCAKCWPFTQVKNFCLLFISHKDNKLNN